MIADCPSTEVCQGGRCHLDCTDNSSVCADTMVCLAGGLCGITCTSNTDCPYGRMCVDSKCELAVSMYSDLTSLTKCH